jgi:hypothetical protein
MFTNFAVLEISLNTKDFFFRKVVFLTYDARSEMSDTDYKELSVGSEYCGNPQVPHFDMLPPVGSADFWTGQVTSPSSWRLVRLLKS